MMRRALDRAHDQSRERCLMSLAHGGQGRRLPSCLGKEGKLWALPSPAQGKKTPTSIAEHKPVRSTGSRRDVGARSSTSRNERRVTLATRRHRLRSDSAAPLKPWVPRPEGGLAPPTSPP